MPHENPLSIINSIRTQTEIFRISKVLVALSGGADSVALAYALKKAGLEIIALHCNFHLRGEESDRDTKFVETFCLQQNIPLEIKHFNVVNYIQENKGSSVEMACRNLRYDWFEERLKDTAYNRIAIGHNADDNIETFFINAFRGAGTRGLKGMEADNGTLWRPLLKFHRNEILDFLKANNLSFIIDSTNLENDYRRNFIRNKVIPLLKEEWLGFDKAMDKTISHLNNENRVVEAELRRILSRNPEKLPVEEISAFPAPMLLVKRFIDPLGPYVTTATEILEAIRANKPHIRRWRLKKGEVVLRNGSLFLR